MMKHHLRIFSGLTAAALCGSLLTVCGNVSAAELLRGDVDASGAVDVLDAQCVLVDYVEVLTNKPSKLTAEQAAAGDIDQNQSTDVVDAQFILTYFVQNTVAGKSVTWDDILAPEKTPLECARDVLETYMTAYLEHDLDTLLDVTNCREIRNAAAAEDYTDERLKEELDKNYPVITGFVIGEGISDEATLAFYNRQMNETKATAAEKMAAETDPEKLAQMERALTIIQPLDELYRFNVTISQEGKEPLNDEAYIYYLNGKWTVDVSLVSALMRYIRLSQITRANSAASSLMKAARSAMIDLDEQNVNISSLSGDYFLHGSDFENLSPVTLSADSSPDEVFAQFKYLIAYYYSSVTSLEDAAMHLGSGTCQYSAASVVSNDTIWYGSYPTTANRDAQQYDDIQAALAGAE